MLVPATDRRGLGTAKESLAMSSETAWKARFARLWRAPAPPDGANLSLGQLRVWLALEAYRQVKLPGVPGPAAVNRVSRSDERTYHRTIALLREQGLMPEGM
jgi:hypothetical protein